VVDAGECPQCEAFVNGENDLKVGVGRKKEKNTP
jgi:hypothetical protein